MRTQEQFADIMRDMKWWHSFHKKPVWLVALDDKYVLSVVKPKPEEIARGTAANLYDVDMNILDRVDSHET